MSEQIRILGVTIHKSSNGLYSLTDLFKASGAKAKDRPTYWLKRQDTKSLVSELEGENSDVRFLTAVKNQRVIEVINGDGGGTFVCNELVYDYAMWISKSFMIRVIRAFDHLANDRILEAQTIANTAINNIIKKREPNGIQTLAVIIGCTVFESRYYYEVLVGKGLLTKKVNKNGQAKYYPVGNQNWFEGYKRNTMLFNSAVLDVLPIQEDLLSRKFEVSLEKSLQRIEK